MKDLEIARPQIKNASIIWPHVLIRICMGRWPLIIVKGIAENITIKQLCYLHAFLNKHRYILEKQK